MCDYCEKKSVLVKKDIDVALHAFSAGLYQVEIPYGVFIRGDRLCFADLDDCSCLDHTENIKINYCPMCGRKL